MNTQSNSKISFLIDQIKNVIKQSILFAHLNQIKKNNLIWTKEFRLIVMILSITAMSQSVYGQITSASLGSTSPFCQGQIITVNFTMALGTATATNNIKLYITEPSSTTYNSTPIATQASGLTGEILWSIPTNYLSGTYNFKIESEDPLSSFIIPTQFSIQNRTVTAMWKLNRVSVFC
ncbi:MAG: hypothetical protein IPO94_10045 [Saprospiraceae bacterium]|nr:hypothetical protein [Saprospiraceae bacterium]